MAEPDVTVKPSSSNKAAAQQSTRVPGTAPIKPEYLHAASSSHRPAVADDDAAEAQTKAAPVSGNAASGVPNDEGTASSEPPQKRLKGAARKAAVREAAAALQATGDVAAGQFKTGHGQNKGRKFKRMADQGARGICHAIARGAACDRGAQCRFSHDLIGYLIEKPTDLHFPLPPLDSASVDGTLQGLSEAARLAYLDAHYSGSAPYVKWVQPGEPSSGEANDAVEQPQPASKDYRHSLSATTYCVCYTATAARGGGAGNGCPAGWKCRYLGAHVVSHDTLPELEGPLGGPPGLRLLRPREGQEPDANEKAKMALDETNYVSTDAMRQLGKRKYPLPLTKAIIEALENEMSSRPEGELALGPLLIDREAARSNWTAQEDSAAASAKKQKALQSKTIDFEELENAGVTAQAPVATTSTDVEQRADDTIKSSEGALDYARVRPPEKRKLDWKHGELYLAPLTTVGNLPFRRICSSLGSDIHCGEMGLADGFLQGSMAEWSLVRRWEGERIFGTQIAGSKPQLLVPVAEALAAEIGDGLDFVDINCGCPIDLVFNRGAGSALMDATGRLSRILRGVSAALGEVPVTIKLRTGTGSKRTAHKLFSRLQTEWGVGAATLHGRSRKQRYKSLADWSYIRECTDALRSSVREWNESSTTADQDQMQTIPIYGNGDVYDWRDYDHNLQESGVDGTMIARGALIKPWLFTEIKEKRDWDISSRERLDLIRQFASFGLTHWGSDTQGVNATRRYMCEWLSFTCRYVPVGILSELPARLNDRPPPFHGRDDLETLLASGDSRDWVKITEMFLGSTPDDWTFTPKHKSNSFTEGGEEQQG